MKIVPASRIGSADRLAKLSRSRETEKSPTSSGDTGSKGWHKAREPDTIIRRWMVHHELHVRQDFKSSIALLDCEFGTAVEPVHLNALTGCETIALKADPIDVRPQFLGIQAAKHAIVLVRCRARHKSDGPRPPRSTSETSPCRLCNSYWHRSRGQRATESGWTPIGAWAPSGLWRPRSNGTPSVSGISTRPWTASARRSQA
jgi:hypothetical protein